MAKAELGRYPTMGTIIYSYWQHILAASESSLPYKALQVNIDMDRRNMDTFYTTVKCLLAILQQKNKIYPISKPLVKNEAHLLPASSLLWISGTHVCSPVWKRPPFTWQNTDFSAQDDPFFMVKHWFFHPKWTPFFCVNTDLNPWIPQFL